MIEILNIFFLIFVSLILLSNVYTIGVLKNKIKIKYLSLANIFSINILILMCLLLIVSFSNINILYVLTFLFITSLLGIFQKKNFNSLFKQQNLFYLIYILILCFILSIDLVTNLKLEWDGHGWYFHAFNFKENLNFYNLYDTDRYNQPHLGGILWSVLWNISFLDHEFYGRIFYIILYLTAILSVSENVSKFLFNRICISSLLIFLTYDRFLFSGYQEILIFSILTIICNLINYLNLKKLTTIQVFFLVTISSLLLWSKNEGIIYFTILICYFIFFQNFKNKIILICLALFSVFLKFYFLNLSEFFSLYFFNKNILLPNLELLFEKSFYISIHLFIAMFKYPIWILFIFMFILKNDFKNSLDVLFFSIISLFIIFLFYLINDLDDYKWLITNSLDRLIFQASGFLLVYVSSSVNSIFRRSKY